VKMRKTRKQIGDRLIRRVKPKSNGKGRGVNTVRWAVDAVGGPLRAAVVMRVSLRTTYEWIRKGEIRLLTPALRLARLSGAPVEKFAGRDDDLKPAGADL